MVDVGKAQVFERQCAKPCKRVIGDSPPALMLVENFANLIFSHKFMISGGQGPMPAATEASVSQVNSL